MMINKSIILLLFLMSCGSSKPLMPTKDNKIVDCRVDLLDAFSLPTREGQLNESSRRIFDDFYNSNFELQIFHVKKVSGYSYREESRIIYLDNGSFYIKNTEGVKKAEFIDLDTVLKKMDQIRKKSFQILCVNNSSLRESNDFYLKQNDQIIFRFNIMRTPIDEIDDVYPNLLNEFAFIKLFTITSPAN